MIFDLTIHLDNVLTTAAIAFGGLRVAIVFRDQIRGLHQTVYGSLEPPVEGLVATARRHDEILRVAPPRRATS